MLSKGFGAQSFKLIPMFIGKAFSLKIFQISIIYSQSIVSVCASEIHQLTIHPFN
jgi:hypothetical protein